MAQEQQQTLYKEMFKVSLYKPTLGKHTRRATLIAVAAIFILGAYSFSNTYDKTLGKAAAYSAAIVLGVVGSWFAFRLTQYPPFADFLINVESEMAKVTWPDKPHLIRGTIVVLSTMMILTASMFLFDIIWQAVFKWIGFIRF